MMPSPLPTTPHYFSPSSLPHGATFDPSRAPRRTMRAIGHTLTLSSSAGVFSKNALDAGSRLLLETFQPAANHLKTARWLDLGCGWGAIGCFLAAAYPEIDCAMCDINPRAATLAAFNARQNELSNATVWCGDGLQAARENHFDAVLCNPPVRAGNRVIEQLFADAASGLKCGGELWVVIRTQQGAKSWQKKLAQQFGHCETLAIEHGYRILKSEKQ